MLSAFASASYGSLRAERDGRINLFYDLERAARDRKTRDRVFLLLPKRRPSSLSEKRHHHHQQQRPQQNGGATGGTTATATAGTEKSGAAGTTAGGAGASEDDVRLEAHTYGQVYAAVLRYAGWLAREKGVRKGDVVALDMMNGERFVTAWFALWALGAVPAFINYNLNGAALLHCVRVSGARLVLVGSEENLKNKYDEGGEVARCLEKGEDGGESEEKRQRVEVVKFGEELDKVLADDGAWSFRPEDKERSGIELPEMGILIYTSGTTGLPKPAVVSWGKLRAASTFVGKWLPLKKGDVLYTCMPLYHTSASLLALLSNLMAHTTLALGHRFSASTLLHDLHLTRATHLQYVGETLRYLLATPPNAILDRTHHVHTIFGNGLRPDVWTRFVERFNVTTVAEFYAATEGPGGMWNKSRNLHTAGAVGQYGRLAERLVWGRAQACVRVDPLTGKAARDPATGRCARVRDGEAGELLYLLDPDDICARFQGYFNNDAATSSKILRGVFADGDAWFSTGDVLRRDRDRRLWWFVDRLGDTFRWKSENVSTAEVASLLGDAAHDVLKEVVVYGVLVPGHDGRAGCAAVVLRDPPASPAKPELERDEEARELQLLQRLADTASKVLPRYAVPLFVRVTAGLAVTGTNKPQKHVLQKEGIDPEVVACKQDRLYWLRDGRYERFGEQEYAKLQGGGVKL